MKIIYNIKISTILMYDQKLRVKFDQTYREYEVIVKLDDISINMSPQ